MTDKRAWQILRGESLRPKERQEQQERARIAQEAIDKRLVYQEARKRAKALQEAQRALDRAPDAATLEQLASKIEGLRRAVLEWQEEIAINGP